MAVPILTLQLIYLLANLVVSGLAAYVPLWLLVKDGSSSSGSKPVLFLAGRKWRGFLSLANGFTAGVLLGMNFLAMLPAAEKKWDSALAEAMEAGTMGEDHPGTSWCHFTMLIGFNIIFAAQTLCGGGGPGGEYEDLSTEVAME